MRTNIITGLMALVGVLIFALHYHDQPWSPHRLIGALLTFTSLVLIAIARIQLGRAFSIEARARRLVTTGLYSRIRNPIYVFAELLFLGVAIFLWSLGLIVVLVALLPIQVLRARKEAEVLEAAFGEEYRRYRAKTWF